MKNIIILATACLTFFSCSNMQFDAEKTSDFNTQMIESDAEKTSDFTTQTMESDVEKACDFITQMMEMIPQMFGLSIAVGFGDEDSKNEAQIKLDELQVNIEKMSEEMDSIVGKYDNEEFQAYFLENCEGAKEMQEISKSLEEIGDIK